MMVFIGIVRNSGQTQLTPDLTAVEEVAFNSDGPAYELMDATVSVREDEGYHSTSS